jgi:TrmH family RNA methyltransferase
VNLGPPITSRSNARVKALRASFNGKASDVGQVVGIEGENLLTEAVRSGLLFHTVYVRQGSEVLLQTPGLARMLANDVVVLSADVFASAVETPSPQGIAATVYLSARPARPNTHGPVLALESVQDPGNLGTLIRSAEAFDVPCILLTLDSANPWNPKTIRASAGSVFRMPVLRTGVEGFRAMAQGTERRIYAAVARGAATVMPWQNDLSDGMIMIGNEGAGLSPEALAIADGLVTIPCEVESLNAAVAGSLLLYEAMRQRWAKGSAT